MARSRPAENQRSRSKSVQIEDLTSSIAKFQEILRSIDDFSQEGFPYHDAAQAKAELQLRERIRQTFGERSPEFQKYRNVKLRTADKTETAQSIAIIKDLIQTLEDRKLELQGLKPPPPAPPSPETSLHNTARLVLVSSPTPSTGTVQATTPMTVAVAMTTNVGPPLSPTATLAPKQEPSEPKALTPPPIPAPPDILPPPLPTAPLASIAPAIPTVAPPPLPPIEQPPAVEKPIQPPPVAMTPAPPEPFPQPTITPMASAVVAPIAPPQKPASLPPLPQDTPLDRLLTGLPGARIIQPSSVDPDPLQLIHKTCLRFHSVARQLRLRKDYRPTLEVEDDYDLQDLLCALLKVEFEEVASEEWTPPYTEGAPRTTLFVNRDQIAIIAKKTRPGLTPKELADQVTADSAYYRAQGRCSTLFCFLYDPEGRIGSPKRLETTLTSVSEHYTVEVLVAPK